MESGGDSAPDDNLQDQALPLPVQIFLWRQMCPFIRPKLGKHHEAACLFCQQAPGHHELKEACKSFEKVLVQDIQYGLSVSLTEGMGAIPRWRLIQAAFPYVMHCTANLLHTRKDTHLQNLGATETKILYTLHWIILLAAEECADSDHEKGIFQTSPFYYLFSVPAITLFVYLFAPISHHLKESDFQTFRLESGLKMWRALWDHRHPDTPCFTAHVKPKPRTLWNRLAKGNHIQFGDVFLGRQQSSEDGGGLGSNSPLSPSASMSYSTEQLSMLKTESSSKPTDEEGNWVSSPKDTVFPETIPEESSSTEEEHVVIFRLPSLSETDGLDKAGTFLASDASIFHLSVGRNKAAARPTLTIEQVTALAGGDVRQIRQRPPVQKMGSSTDKESVSSKGKQGSLHKLHMAMQSADVRAATFLDVAVLRCLFMSQWPEEGVYWALQFIFQRLREVSDDTMSQQQPRRRSNSLPIPKIEVSFYQSPEMAKKDSIKDCIEVPEEKDVRRLTESPYFGRKPSEESLFQSRRGSEKQKKKMKMADLRAFVETKLLSKSDRALERLDQDETNIPFKHKEHHHSLDTGDDHLSRPASVLSRMLDPMQKQHLGWSNLVKGKSMPSLRYIPDNEKLSRVQRRHGPQPNSVNNPIITVTEHSPAPSPDSLKRQSSIDSQLDELSLQGKSGLSSQDRKPSLTRSQTDSNITYACEELPEAPGAACYITKDGDIDILVVLKAIHSVALRSSQSCTVRVCEVIFNLMDLVLDLGVLKRARSGESSPGSGGKDDFGSVDNEQDLKDGCMSAKSIHDKNLSPHNLALNTVLRIYKHLGCPHGCAEGQRGPPIDFLRSQGQTILMKLHRNNPKQFSKFLRDTIRNQNLPDILEFFHAYLGFCVDPSSLLSPLRKHSDRETGPVVSRVVLDQKRSSSKSPEGGGGGQGGYSTNFGAGLRGGGSRGVEGHILASVFKTLVSRMVKLSKELKAQENTPIYCDIRQLMTYVKEAHGSVFRRVALSGILDATRRPNKEEPTQTTRVIRHLPHSDNEDHNDLAYFMDEKGQRKFLFKKKSTSSACGVGMLETETTDDGGKSQSPVGNTKRRGQPTLTPRHSEKNLGILACGLSQRPLPPVKPDKQPKLMKIGGIVNWFKKEHGRSNSLDGPDEPDTLPESAFQRQQSLHRSLAKSTSKGNSGDLKQALQKTKKRVEDQIKKNFGFRKGKKKDGSLEENSGSYMSRRNSMEAGDASRDSDYVIFRERKLVSLPPVLNGMKRFSFLLETCQPGTVPDHHLLAAVLDLPHAPVVARAGFLLECAYFVHNLNKGIWPAWMKLNFPMFKASVPNQVRDANVDRRTHILQRSTGKLFYQWAEAIGARLEEMLANDKERLPEIVSMVTDESKQKELLMEDEEEDFLDEGNVSLCEGQCPSALRLIACILLLEITAFLRETYQSVQKSSRVSGKDRPPAWERMYSRDANRRWSMALSSMGHSQASAQSLQSIAGDTAVPTERKISFVLHEPDNESEGSSNTTVTIHGEEPGTDDKEKDKKGRNRASSTQHTSRPSFFRRSNAPNTTGSFKRKSLKLRRGTKDGIKEAEVDFKRTDSIQSKRKVSSLSDRSDTSEPGAAGEISGEESPGVLSDEQVPESPTDSNETDETAKNMPWLKVVVQVAHSFNFFCSHQSFCHPFCYRRQMRSCERLMRAVRKVYGEQSGLMAAVEAGLRDKERELKKDKSGRGRKVSDHTNSQSSPVRRKGSLGKKEKNDGVKRKDSDLDIEKNAQAVRSTIQCHPEKLKEELPIMHYLTSQIRNVFHAPLAVILKGAVVLSEDLFIEIMPIAWELLLENDQEVVASAAALFIVCAIRQPNHASNLVFQALSHHDVSTRINAILRFQTLWKLRYQVMPRMEDGAHSTFKIPPPGIEFTLPSPKIGNESVPVVDPPWEPIILPNKNEEGTNQEARTRPLGREDLGARRRPRKQLLLQRSEVTAPHKTRKKQQTELITMALQAQEDKKRSGRENFYITTIPIAEQAGSPVPPTTSKNDDDSTEDEEENPSQHVNTCHSVFPSCLCSAVLQIITLLDDCAVSPDGNAVYEVAYTVTWNCLVEDSPLFLRYILERITREKQDEMFKILRHLIRFVPKLPQQAAFSLYNYIIGYVMFYVRSFHEEGQQMIGTALSVLWMVVHSVNGIMFKDLKQNLRKEQCDASILLTANVPSAKKIVVHGPQEQASGGIPSQFPVQEDTQFCQILRESLDFFGIEESKHKEYFLVDHKTRQIHNPSSYVRDFYFFKRSQYPQLELIYMKPEDAFNGLQKQELIHKFVEIGKVLLTWAILKNVDMVVQRVVFLHEELMKLPSFPRKALESDLDLYTGGELGKELLGLDVLHKFMWVRLIARMFEAMAGNFAYSGDIHLFLNVLNGAIILHSEDSCILRYVVATYINAAHHFKNIFATNGYLLIMPTLLQIYSNHQTNKLVRRTVEYCVKQFYLMNRKPFILQMFGSLSAILDTDEDGQYGDAHKVQAKCLFKLLLSLETPSPDPLNIAELVREGKPLKPIDFCYRDEDEMVTILDCISLCVMVVAFASDSVRGHQMLIILEAILPHYLREIQKPNHEKEGKTEREIIQQLSAAMRTLIHNCELLGKNYNGPQKSSPEHKGSSQRNFSRGPYSPGFDFDDDEPNRYLSDHGRNKIHYEKDNMEDSDIMVAEYRRPRDIFLSLVSDYTSKCTTRLAEMPKKVGFEGKPFELLDIRSHLRLVDVAHSLLKVAPYDSETMGCTGLQRYMNQVFPYTDWSIEALRPALITLLRRLDKTFIKIYKKPSIRRKTDWEAAAGILKGVFELMIRLPYIVHMQNLKALINTCQLLIVGDTSNLDISATEPLVTRVLMAVLPPPHFNSIVIKLILLQIQAMGESYSLENVCGGNSIFPDKKKTESMLMNLLMPLCLRVSGGRKDVPTMRPQDIGFAVTVILHTMNPPANKTAPLTAQNIKSLSEMRSGSLAVGREPKKPIRLPQTTYQVAFLALKIVIVAFETELTVDWPRIAKTVREVGRIWDLGSVIWEFLDFVATQRTPLYVLLLPFLYEKVNTPPLNDSERHMQFAIREKLRGFNTQGTKSRAALLIDLVHEMRNLKEEFENGKPEDRTDNARSGDQLNVSVPSDGIGYTRHHRPSLIGFFTGANEPKSNPSDIQLKPVRSHRNSVASVNEKKEKEEHEEKNTSREKERLFHRHRGIKLRFVSKVEMKDDSGETSVTPLSPGSPADESSTEVNGQQDKPKLVRSKAQSRKTFRLRRSRKSRLDRLEDVDTSSEKICYSTPATPTQISTESQHEFIEQLRQQKEKLVKDADERRADTGRWSHQGSMKSATSPSISTAELKEERTASEQSAAHVYSAAYPTYRPAILLKADLSLDEDTPSAVSQTSSTSGYRESCSLVTMTMESPTLLRPSSIPATTSPESSLTSNGGEDETAVLARSSSSQHSLLMLFEAQDEDTLI